MGATERLERYMAVYTRPVVPGVQRRPVPEAATAISGGVYEQCIASLQAETAVRFQEEPECFQDLEPILHPIEVSTDVKKCGTRRCAGTARDDTCILRGLPHTFADPSRSAMRIIGCLGLFADLSLDTVPIVPAPLYRGILSSHGQQHSIAETMPVITVDFLGRRQRFCANRAIARETIDLRRLETDGRVRFRRVFSAIDFCDDNRAASLRAVLKHLLILQIAPVSFMRTRFLAFYNQEVGASQLASDVVYYAALFDVLELPLAPLVEYLEDSIAEQTGDPQCAVLYATIWNLSRIAELRGRGPERSTRISGPNVPENIGQLDAWVVTDTPFLNKNNLFFFSLAMKIRQSLRRTLEEASGFRRITRLFQAVVEYKNRGVCLTAALVSERYAPGHIPQRHVIAAVDLLGRMNISVPYKLMHRYKSVINQISARFCAALNSNLKNGEAVNLYDRIAWLAKVESGAGRCCKGGGSAAGQAVNQSSGGAGTDDTFVIQRSGGTIYALDRLVRDIEGVYVRRIGRCKSIMALEPVYRSVLQFYSVFGPSDVVEAELKLFIRARAVREARGWPGGILREKIRSILNE